MIIKKESILTVLISAALIITASFPLAVNLFNGRIPIGTNIDLAGNMWLMWRFKAILNDDLKESPFVTRLLCYPFTFDIRYNFSNMFPAFLYSFAVSFNHFNLTFNILIMLIFAFNYTGVYFFCEAFP